MNKKRTTRSTTKKSSPLCQVVLKRETVKAHKDSIKEQRNSIKNKSATKDRSSIGTNQSTSIVNAEDYLNFYRSGNLNRLTPNETTVPSKAPRARKTFPKPLCRNVLTQVNNIQAANVVQRTSTETTEHYTQNKMKVKCFIDTMTKLNADFASNMVELRTEFCQEASALKREYEKKVNDAENQFMKYFEL